MSTDQPDPRSQPRGTLQRRLFLKRAALGIGATGLAIAVPGALMGEATNDEAEAVSAAADDLDLEGLPPMVAYVRDAAAGDVVILAGTSEVEVRDLQLARRLIAGMRAASA
ncbi:MAG: hypothetical protein R3C39_10230 [Dehalococcoidia bacterium]